MSTISLSIVSPSYNNGLTIPDLLDSVLLDIKKILSLTSSFEIIISDNHSTDNTAEIIEKYQKDFSRLNIKYVKPERHLCPIESLNFAISKATGDYIWIIGDDYFVDSAIPFVLEKIVKYNSDIIIVNSVLQSKSGIITERYYINRIDYAVINKSALYALDASMNHLFISNYIFKKHIYKPNDNKWPHVANLIQYLQSGKKNISVLQSKSIIIENEANWYSKVAQIDDRTKNIINFIDLIVECKRYEQTILLSELLMTELMRLIAGFTMLNGKDFCLKGKDVINFLKTKNLLNYKLKILIIINSLGSKKLLKLALFINRLLFRKI